jgi:hypothetical protein
MAGIKAVFPTIRGTEESATLSNIRLAKTIALLLNIDDIQVAGDSARARAVWQMSVSVMSSRGLQQNFASGLVPVSFDLSKADGSWVIGYSENKSVETPQPEAIGLRPNGTWVLILRRSQSGRID